MNRRGQCKNNLKQLGLAMHNYHDAWKCYPPGLVDDDGNPSDGQYTGFVLLLPFVEETALYNAYNLKVGSQSGTDDALTPRSGWMHPTNSTVVSKQLSQFYCPSNRSEGVVALGRSGWVAGATDYAMASGAAPLLCSDRVSNENVAKLRGYFGINASVRVSDVKDGTSQTVAMGEVSGGETWLGTTNMAGASVKPADALGARPSDPTLWFVDQGWAVARIDGRTPHWPRGSVLFAAYQHLGADNNLDSGPDKLAARMNTQPLVVSAVGQRPGDAPCGSRDDRLSPVRSAHEGGAQFLFGDGTVRFISENVDQRVYAAIFTIAGGEVVDEDDF